MNRTFLLIGLVATALLAATGGARPETQSEPMMGPDCTALSREVQQLAKIVNTRNGDYHCLGARVDKQQNIISLRFETHRAGAGPSGEGRGSNLATVQVRDFTPQQIASPYGVVLDGTPGHDAVLLQGRIVGGAVEQALLVRFLHNGLTGEFRACPVTLDRDEGAIWFLQNARRQEVSLIVVKTWSLPLIGAVGIDTMQGIC